MSRTSKTLMRLGVPTLAAATMLGGVPAFFGTANAAHVAAITITPVTTASAAAGTCQPYVTTLHRHGCRHDHDNSSTRPSTSS